MLRRISGDAQNVIRGCSEGIQRMPRLSSEDAQKTRGCSHGFQSMLRWYSEDAQMMLRVCSDDARKIFRG